MAGMKKVNYHYGKKGMKLPANERDLTQKNSCFKCN